MEREDNLDSVDMKHKFMLAMAEYMARIGMGIKPNILSDQAPEENTYWRRLVIMTKSVTFSQSCIKLKKFKKSLNELTLN